MTPRPPSLLWGCLAPVIIAGGLLGLRSAPAVFAAYHVGLCLVVPAVVARRRGLTWRQHAEALGLVRGGVAAGIAMGLGMAAIILGAYAVVPGLYVRAETLQQGLAAWGITPELLGPTFVFLVVVNSPAEELFWRGWLLGPGRPSRWRVVALVLLFTSYHAVTMVSATPGLAGLVAKLAAVAGAAVFWTWSRQRWGSIWVAVLSHGGAAVGYVVMGWWILRPGQG